MLRINRLKMSSSANLTPSPSIHLNLSMQMKTGVRSNFASQHLQAAEYFARKSGELESEHSGEPLGVFISEINHLVVATIFSSVASMEANINEYIYDKVVPDEFDKKYQPIKKDGSGII